MERGSDLFRALELAHYAERFRNALFVIGLPAESAFQDLLLDFKVLAGYHIRLVLVSPDPTHQLEELVSRSNKRGSRFHLSLATELVVSDSDVTPELDFDRLNTQLNQGETPIIAHHPDQKAPPGLDPVFPLAREVARRLQARKLFLGGAPVESLRQAAVRTHVLGEELPQMRERLNPEDSASLIPWLDFVEESLAAGIPDLILCEGKPGELYQESFTHDGAGLLFNNLHSESIRPASVRDVTDIALLIRPEIEAGRILPVNEDRIEEDIQTYWVYEINGLLAGLARLRAFGDWAELSQFSTLPRYRGKGRARELAQHLEQEARTQDFSHVFALSIDDRMWEFFKGLGFSEMPRGDLPEAWRAGYNMERPSRAFVKALDDQSTESS